MLVAAGVRLSQGTSGLGCLTPLETCRANVKGSKSRRRPRVGLEAVKATLQTLACLLQSLQEDLRGKKTLCQSASKDVVKTLWAVSYVDHFPT